MDFYKKWLKWQQAWKKLYNFNLYVFEDWICKGFIGYSFTFNATVCYGFVTFAINKRSASLFIAVYFLPLPSWGWYFLKQLLLLPARGWHRENNIASTWGFLHMYQGVLLSEGYGSHVVLRIVLLHLKPRSRRDKELMDSLTSKCSTIEIGRTSTSLTSSNNLTT